MLSLPRQARIQVRTTLVDEELAAAMRELLALPRAARVFRYEWEGELLQPDEQAAERLRQALHGRRIQRQGLPHLGRDAPRRDRASPSARSATASPRRRPTRSGRSAAVMRARRASSSETRPAVCRASYVSPGGHRPVSRRDERSRISAPAICAWSARAISVSIRRNRRSSACSARGVFARRARPRDFRLRISATFTVHGT